MKGDLNKFISENCTKKMTSIDLDVFLLKFSERKSRIIESKHSNEGTSKGQRQAYNFLVSQLKCINKSWTHEVHYVYGNYPYKELIVLDLINNRTFKVEGDEVKKYLELSDYKRSNLSGEEFQIINTNYYEK